MSDQRSKVLISGYYGFNNLGDEAILEELCAELKRLGSGSDVFVLSADPHGTQARYAVQAISRNDFFGIWKILQSARLLVSGGGGLFQNTRNLASIVFYGLHILLAKAAGVKVMIYAQGIGPLHGGLAKHLTRLIFRQASSISLRDEASMRILNDWNVKGIRTADPVWSLAESALPRSILDSLSTCTERPLSERPFVAVSLRPSPHLSPLHLATLADLLADILPKELTLLLLPLQEEQDLPLLKQFSELLSERRRNSYILDGGLLERPSQWISLFSFCRMAISMRLHALIMALKVGIPVAGIDYDPKVSQLLTDFGQPILILSKECEREQWGRSLEALVSKRDSLAATVQAKLDTTKNLSCQNFDILATMLDLPRDVP